MKDKITKLIEVKKIIALMVIFVFCFLSITGRVQEDTFVQIAIIIISFYFGQSTAKSKNV